MLEIAFRFDRAFREIGPDDLMLPLRGKHKENQQMLWSLEQA